MKGIVGETPREHIGRLLRSVFEAPSAAEGVAALDVVFERDVQLHIDDRRVDWIWLKQHVRESFIRLQNVSIEVTHAVREGETLFDRHLVSATARETGARWQIEVMALYELSAASKIRRIREMTRMQAGEYSGW